MNLFTHFIYQPFLNLLVAIYMGINAISGGNTDMGIAVIIFTIALRFILLPLSLASSRTEAERREIEEKVAEINRVFKDDPLRTKSETKKLLKGNRRILISEGLNLTIQIIVALMLYRLFAKGLLGSDLHLLYDFCLSSSREKAIRHHHPLLFHRLDPRKTGNAAISTLQ